jgi:NAD(P)-dependent dehydrogenase (short-subunit alcohol dehydrogenase family)
MQFMIDERLFRLDGQTAIVVGGTGTLGGAMARALARFGARLVVIGRNAQRGEELASQINGSGGDARFLRADACDRTALEAAREEVLARSASVDVLVNAAGGNRPAATLAPGAEFCSLPEAAWREVFDLNLVGGVLLPCQVFGQAMLSAGKGSIINIASVSAVTPLSRVVAYSAAKAAVVSLTQFLAREWAPRGVRVNALSPGFFPAEQNRALLFNADGSPTERGRQILAHTPMARMGQPDELAGAVVWLASGRASSFVTGQNIVVDGGFTATTI